MLKITKNLVCILFLIVSCHNYCQVGIGTTSPAAALEISSPNDGLLISRISLVNTTTSTIITPTVSELIYNIATAGDVTPGFYFWDGAKWNKLAAGVSTDWSLSGNSGTTPGINFLGTTSNVDLRIKTNNSDRFDFTNNGRLRSYDNGTPALPTYSWNGDIDTGFYRPTADGLGFATNGIDRLRIFPAGQIAIGSATPQGIIDIASATNGIIIPRIALTARNSSLPVVNPQGGALAAGTFIWNTATVSGTQSVSPGFYYWDSSVSLWIALAGTGGKDWSINGNTGTTASNFIGTSDAIPFRITTNSSERMRVLSTGEVVINNTTAISGDRLSVFGTGADFSINGYSTLVGTGVYGGNNGTGYGVQGINTGTGAAVAGFAAGAAIYGATTGATSAGIFGRADLTAGAAVYGTSNGSTGTGVFGNTSGATSDAVYGQSSGINGTGIYGFANASGGDGIYGQSTGLNRFGVRGVNNNDGYGVYGTSSSAAGMGLAARNGNAAGTGLIAVGNNITGTFLTAGSGGSFTGLTTGLYSTTNATNGVGVLASGNNQPAFSFTTNGGGGAFTGSQFGVTGFATVTATATDHAALAGNYFSDASTQSSVYVGAVIGGVHYKIMGTNAGSVSTTMTTQQGERVMFAPEAPENWFFDIGEVQLVDGYAKVSMDPLFVDCISDSKPFKVFVQGGENTLGSIRITRDQKDKSFIVEDLGGKSSGIVQYNVYAIWRTKENLRFPEIKEGDLPRATSAQTSTAPVSDSDEKQQNTLRKSREQSVISKEATSK